MKPILKYTGGKMQDLKVIKKCLPKHINNYFEPFVGGGAVWLNIKAHHYFINDTSVDLIRLYTYLKEHNQTFIQFVKNISQAWDLSYLLPQLKVADFTNEGNVVKFDEQIKEQFLNSCKFLHFSSADVFNQLKKSTLMKYRHLKRRAMKNHEKVTDRGLNILTGVKTAIYTLLRYKYNYTKNPIAHTACYWFLREYGYSSMFRFNRHGKFNVPYGGISYNHKNIRTKLQMGLSQSFQKLLQNTKLYNLDFEKMLDKTKPKGDDFVFLDPPYNTKFSTYDRHPFGDKQQIRLANYLKHHLKANYMMVIQNTPLISKLYKQGEPVINHHKLNILTVGRRYSINFKNRNLKAQKVKYLIITNYSVKK